MRLILRAEKGLYKASKVMAVIATIALSAMMLLCVADVIGRYFFNHPIGGTWDIVSLLLVCASTWGLGYCQTKKSHISVTILAERFSRRTQAIIRSAAYLIGLSMFSLISWQVLLLAKRYFFLTRGNVTTTLEIPYYPFILLLAVGTGMLALILLIDLRHSLDEVARK